MKHLFEHINNSVRTNWNEIAFSDFHQQTSYTYGQCATKVAELGLLYDRIGIKKKEKIAICGSNCSNIGIGILSALCNDYVAVTILPDFTGTDIEKLVNHSDAQLLIASEATIHKINPRNMPNIKAIVSASDFSAAYTQPPVQTEHAPSLKEKDEHIINLKEAFTGLADAFREKYPDGYSAKDVNYRTDNLEELAVINYTSGTTSEPKGVMVSYRALSSNIQYDIENMECHPGITIVSMLPLAHMFGLVIEFLYYYSAGGHVCFLTKLTTPILMSALKENHPILILSVPMVLEKIYERKIKPVVSKKRIRLLWNVPRVGNVIKNKIREGLLEAFGGNLNSFIVGGAALNPEVEKCLMDIHFPIVVGYGMTECAPLVTYTPWKRYRAGSCGQLIDRMEIKIDSSDEHRIPGEILLRGENLMMGYYKNEKATQAALDKYGWLHTGDMGVIDYEGYLYLRGRCKNMILGSSGQNIYPEEIESLLNIEPIIQECLVIQRGSKIVALIYPNQESEFSNNTMGYQLRDAVNEAISRVNQKLPAYSKIASFEIRKEEFQKTPKLSIKRHLYK